MRREHRVAKRERYLQRKARKAARKLKNHRADLHHVPPRSNGFSDGGFVLSKRRIDHKAYHQLFKNAGSYEECCAILLRDWWTRRA